MTDEQQKLDLEFAMLELAQVVAEDEQPAWALLAVAQDRHEEYKEAIASGKDINLYDYGDVLAYKVGMEKPTEAEEQELTEKFGYIPNLNIEEKIAKMVGEKES